MSGSVIETFPDERSLCTAAPPLKKNRNPLKKIWGEGRLYTGYNERLLTSNLGISFFPSHRFGVVVKGNSIVLETYPSPRR